MCALGPLGQERVQEGPTGGGGHSWDRDLVEQSSPASWEGVRGLRASWEGCCRNMADYKQILKHRSLITCRKLETRVRQSRWNFPTRPSPSPGRHRLRLHPAPALAPAVLA